MNSKTRANTHPRSGARTGTLREDPLTIRVLHVLCDLNGGGAERLVLDLCRLSAPDIDPSVVTVHDGGVMGAAFRGAGVALSSVGRRRGRPGFRAMARIARLARSVDIVHTHLWAADTWGRIGAALARSPRVVTTEHNTAGESVWRQWLTRRLDPLSDRVVGVSEAAAAGVQRRGVPADRVRVIVNGVDLDRFATTPLPPGPPWRLLALGRLSRQKGLDVLIEAMALLPPSISLDIVGEGEDRAALESAALCLGGRVRLGGWSDDVAGCISRCHVVVIPSRWEGFGLVAIEAMASGRPVIASRVSGLDEAVGESGLLVDPRDPVALAGAIQRVLQDGAVLADLRLRGLERSRRFGIRATTVAYEDLYRSLAVTRSGQ